MVRHRSPDAIVFGGDMLQRSTPAALDALLRGLSAFRLPPCHWIAGNRDPTIEELLAGRGLGIDEGHCFESSPLTAAGDAIPATGGSNAPVVMSHRPPTRGSDAQVWIAGHTHAPSDSRLGAIRVVVSAGLDPTRCAGGLGDVLVVDTPTRPGRVARVERIPISPAALTLDRVRWVRLGIAPRASVTHTLVRAAEEGIPAVQLAAGVIQDRAPSKEQRRSLRMWRDSVEDPLLSLHLPPLAADDDRERLETCLAWGIDAGVDDYTLHPPATPARTMVSGGELTPSGLAFCESCARHALRITAEGATVGLENMHNPPERGARLFSTVPRDMRIWVRGVRDCMANLGATEAQRQGVSMLLDLGHARNNPPISGEIAPSEWIAVLADLVRNLHIHQVHRAGRSLSNHHALTSPYGPLINYAGILLLLRATPGPPSVAFAEVRDLDEAVQSLGILGDW